MSITRAPRPERNFYMLDKQISEDKRLSWAARGLLIYLLGKPDHWTVSPAALVNETKGSDKPSGRDAVYSLLKELLNAGYLSRVQNKKGGQFDSVDYLVSETPEPQAGSGSPPHTDLPDTAQPDTDEPHTANPTLVSTDFKQGLRKAVRTEKSAPRLSLPEWLDPDLWAEWVTHRKEKKCPMTESSATKTIEKLARLKDQGHSPKAVIDHSIAGGYQGIFAPRTDTVVGSVKRPKSLHDMDYSTDLF